VRPGEGTGRSTAHSSPGHFKLRRAPLSKGTLECLEEAAFLTDEAALLAAFGKGDGHRTDREPCEPELACRQRRRQSL
jgi:hypothetical protein